MVTDDELRQIMPNCGAQKRAAYLPFIQQAMQEFGITSFLREAAFLAQLAHESGELRFMEEIASGAAYEGRRDLGNTQPGDGRRYKGRGPIQLTGRANYKKFGDLLGLDLINNPTMAATPQVGFRIAGLFWKSRGLNELADQQDFRTITKRINGGFNGLPDRIQFYERAKRVLSRDDGDVAPPPPTATTAPSDQPAAGAGGAAAPAYPGTPLRQGSRGAAVQTMQQRLRDLGANITADGNFGPGTRQAVIAFQRNNGVTGDGIVGPSTWRLLFGATAKGLAARKSAKKAAKKSMKKSAKKAVKKAAKTAAKRPAKKAAKKAAKKVARKAAKKSAGKAATKSAKKATKKSAKKSAARGAAKKRAGKGSRK